jgi:hypothetical protein
MANEDFNDNGNFSFDDAAADFNEYPDFTRSAGDSIRDIINPALADTRKEKLQLDVLDKIFANTAQDFPDIVAQNLSDLFNGISFLRDEDDKNRILIEKMTLAGIRGAYSPIIKLQLPVAVDFAAFAADDICKLPGYIKFHEAARFANVAVKVNGLLQDEAQGGGPPPHIVIDASKTYEQGAMENARLYPNLPDRKAANDDVVVPKKTFNFD